MIQKTPHTRPPVAWRYRPKHSSHWLLDRQALRDLLKRERMRCDRGGEPFALVTLRPAETGQSKKHLRRLAAIVRRRLRWIDVVGQLDSHTLAAVLPLTDDDGARRVAEDIEATFARRGGRLQWNVFVYPQSMDQHRFDEEDQRDSRPMGLTFSEPLPTWKRGVDILGACVGLLLTWPILLVSALAIKITSRGPVLFKQQRAGLGGRPFTLYKLRTMVVDAQDHQDELRAFSEQDGPAFKMKNDPRVTTVGRFFRRTCIDELPQLLNVLRGDMTLVGPRPLPCDEADACRPWQKRRTDVTPGLTCIWQAAGGHRVADFDQWMRMDLQYADQRGFWHDVKLLVKTVWKVLRMRGSC